MENMDGEKARQVWQRVKPVPEPTQELRVMELAALENLGVYRSLSGRFVGLPRQQLAELMTRSSRECAMLAGIRVLSGGKPGPMKPPLSHRGTAAEILTGCYHRSRRSLVEYTARWSDRDFGCLFQSLSHMTQESCGLIAEILGQVGK